MGEGKTEKVKFDISVQVAQATKALSKLTGKATELQSQMKGIGNAMRGDFMSKVIGKDKEGVEKGQRFYEKSNDARVNSMEQTIRKQEALGKDGMNAATDMSVARQKMSVREWKADKEATSILQKNFKQKEGFYVREYKSSKGAFKAIRKNARQRRRISKRLSKQYGTEVKDFEIVNGKYKPLIAQRAKANAELEQSMKKQRTAAGMNNLTFLFLGQSISKVFTSIAQSSMQTFSQIAGDTNAVNVQFKAMGVALDVIKFSIGQGIASLLSGMIPMVMNIAEGFLNMSESSKKWLGGLVVGGIIIGKLITIMANLALISMSMGNMGFFKAAFWVKFGGIFKAVFSTVWIKSLWAWVLKLGTKFGWVSTVLTKLGTFFTWIGGLGAGMIAAIVVAIAAVVITLIIFKRKLGSWGNAFKAMGIFLLAILAAVGDGIVGLLLLPLKAIVAVINAVKKGMNALGMNGGSPIELPEWMDFGAMSKKVWEMRNKLIADGEALKAEQAAEDAAAASPAQDDFANVSDETLMADAQAQVVVNQTNEYNVQGNGDEFLENKFSAMKAESDKATEDIIKTYQSTGGDTSGFAM